ncbi:hypothetical protein Tco_0194794 [Tanacetum coccineum]
MKPVLPDPNDPINTRPWRKLCSHVSTMNFCFGGTSTRAAKTKYNTNFAHLLPNQIYSPCIVDWGVLNLMGYTKEIEAMLEIKVYEVGGQEEIFCYEVWRRAFDINEPIYTELCHEFYSTYKFDEVVTDDELMTKKLIKFRLGEGFEVYIQGGLRSDENFNAKAMERCAFDIREPIYAELCHEFYATYEFDKVVFDEDLMSKKLIKFRLGGRGHTLTILEFARRLGLYTSDEIQDEGFETYFRGEVRALVVTMFEAKASQMDYAECGLVDCKLIARWLKRKGVGSQRDSMICCWHFITRMAKRMGLLIDEVLNGLSSLTFCRALNATTLRELIDSNGRLIDDDLALGLPRVAMPKPLRPSMQDLYDRMGNMEIRQGVLERMARRQSYQFDRYARVFEYTAGQHEVPLQGAYAPPGYEKEQQED